MCCIANFVLLILITEFYFTNEFLKMTGSSFSNMFFCLLHLTIQLLFFSCGLMFEKKKKFQKVNFCSGKLSDFFCIFFLLVTKQQIDSMKNDHYNNTAGNTNTNKKGNYT